MFNFLGEAFKEIVLPILVTLCILAVVVGIVRGVMFLVSHFWLSLSL